MTVIGSSAVGGGGEIASGTAGTVAWGIFNSSSAIRSPRFYVTGGRTQRVPAEAVAAAGTRQGAALVPPGLGPAAGLTLRAGRQFLVQWRQGSRLSSPSIWERARG